VEERDVEESTQYQEIVKIDVYIVLRYMMHRKALLFAPNDPTAHAILSPNSPAPHPRVLRELGRKIPNFSEEIWEKHRFEIVVEGNYLKFTQDAALKAQLLATEEREIVEASPRDRIWGVGYGAKNASANRRKWGMNLLGKAIMEVRERIRKEEARKED
jgi:ribA/ribD-fused uncharacterized protein